MSELPRKTGARARRLKRRRNKPSPPKVTPPPRPRVCARPVSQSPEIPRHPRPPPTGRARSGAAASSSQNMSLRRAAAVALARANAAASAAPSSSSSQAGRRAATTHAKLAGKVESSGKADIFGLFAGLALSAGFVAYDQLYPEEVRGIEGIAFAGDYGLPLSSSLSPRFPPAAALTLPTRPPASFPVSPNTPKHRSSRAASPTTLTCACASATSSPGARTACLSRTRGSSPTARSPLSTTDDRKREGEKKGGAPPRSGPRRAPLPFLGVLPLFAPLLFSPTNERPANQPPPPHTIPFPPSGERSFLLLILCNNKNKNISP